jgi:hypothetical protein
VKTPEAMAAEVKGKEDGWKKKMPQDRSTAPQEVQEAYLAGYAAGVAERTARAAFRRTHGPRPRL